MNPPTFEEWVEHCFHPGHFDPSGDTEEELSDGSTCRVTIKTDELFNDSCCKATIPPIEQAAYITRLFESPRIHMANRSDSDLARAIWYLFSTTEEHLRTVFSKHVPDTHQIRLVRSIGTLYTDLFDRVCNRRGECPEEELYITLPLDGAVYMMWDIGIECFVLEEPLRDHAVEVLRTALMSCTSSSCHMSALHGLGHAIYDFEHFTKDQATADRLRTLIHVFLNLRKRPEWLVKYAHQALTGVVQ